MFSGINRVLHNETGGWYWLYPDVDGIGYWNEDMDAFSNDIEALAPPGYGYTNSEMIEDYNYIGWMQDVDGSGSIDLNSEIMFYLQNGASTMPTITIDDQNQIFVLFASTTETYEYDVYNFKHIWGRAYSNGLWHHFIDLTSDLFHILDECIYPQLASTSDDSIHYTYNADWIPGLAFDGNQAYIENRVIYGKVAKSDFLPPQAIEESSNENLDLKSLIIHPNPFSTATTIEYILPQHGNASITIFDNKGQQIESLQLGNLTSGKHKFEWNASTLPNGIYFVQLRAGDEMVTRKVVKTGSRR